MYCRNCYDPLEPTQRACSNCGQRFDAQDYETFLNEPFPSGKRVLWDLFVITLFAIVVAFWFAEKQIEWFTYL